MDLSVAFLGTGGSVPSARRATACVLVRAGGDRILFDCGEGAQRQMQRSTGLVQVHAIYLTHYHADHFLGLPGLLKTYDLNDRAEPLRIYGPPGLHDLFKTLRRIIGRVGYEVELIELEPGDVVEYGDYEIAPFEVEHRVRGLRLHDRRARPARTPRRGQGRGPRGSKWPRAGQADPRRDRSRQRRGGDAGTGDGGDPPGASHRDHRRHPALHQYEARCGRGAAAGPRRELQRRGRRARRGDLALDGAPGGGDRRRRRGADARPGPHLLAIRRPRSPRRGS